MSPFRGRLASSGCRSAAGVLIHFSQHLGGFYFKSLLCLFVICLGKLPGSIFETQVAEVFVNCIAAFHQLVKHRTMRRGIRSVWADVENEINARHGKQRASDCDINATHRGPYPTRVARAQANRLKLSGLTSLLPPIAAATGAPRPTK